MNLTPSRFLGYVDYTGSAQKLDSSTASAIMDFSSDEASACSSESFWSLDGGHLGSPSPVSSKNSGYFLFCRSSLLSLLNLLNMYSLSLVGLKTFALGLPDTVYT